MVDASAVIDQFDVKAFIPPAIGDNVAMAVDYYDQFRQATKGMSIVKGTVQLSDEATQGLLTATEIGLQAIPVVGQVFAAIMFFAPKAGPGPGVCSTDPPSVADRKNPTPSELAAWAHHTSWKDFFGSNYPVGSPGSFEAYANPILAWNWELSQNCFANLYVPSPILLASLIGAWNATHKSSSSKKIVRVGLNPQGFGLPGGWDPIAEALESAVVVKAGGDPWRGHGPYNVMSSFVVNAGPVYNPATFSGAAPAAPTRTVQLRYVPSVTRDVLVPTLGKAVPKASGHGILWGLGALMVIAGGSVWLGRRHG